MLKFCWSRGENRVKQILLIPFLVLVLWGSVHAEPLYNCVDSKGNEFITTDPQDGMNCSSAEAKEEQSGSRKTYKGKAATSDNLVEICNNLFAESEDISSEIKSFEPRLSELQKEQLDIRQYSVKNNWNYNIEREKSKPINEERNRINQQISLLYQKKNLVDNDLRSYKCEQLRQDLSRLNRGSGSTGPSSGSRRGSVIIRNSTSVIIRN